MARVLDLDRMARLAYKDREYEPVFRRAVIDKSAHRMRQVLAGIGWDIRLTQWIHGIFIDFLPPIYMTIYMDILQVMQDLNVIAAFYSFLVYILDLKIKDTGVD